MQHCLGQISSEGNSGEGGKGGVANTADVCALSTVGNELYRDPAFAADRGGNHVPIIEHDRVHLIDTQWYMFMKRLWSWRAQEMLPYHADHLALCKRPKDI